MLSMSAIFTVTHGRLKRLGDALFIKQVCETFEDDDDIALEQFYKRLSVELGRDESTIRRRIKKIRDELGYDMKNKEFIQMMMEKLNDENFSIN